MGATGYIIKEHGGSLAPQKEVEVTPADGTIDVERVESGDVVNFRIKTTYDGYEIINCGSGYASGYFKAIHVKFNDENRRYRLVCILNGGSYTPVAEDFAIYYIKFGWKTGGANADHWYIQEYSRRGNGSFVALEQIALNEYNILIHTPSSWSYANIGILKEDKEDNVTIEHFNGASTAYTPTGTIITTDTPEWKNGAPAIGSLIPSVVNPVAGQLGYYSGDSNLYYFDGTSWRNIYALVETNSEDLTTKDGLLQFNDRSANNGLGYVILRTDKSFAAQVIQTNTIYEIRYNFDLGGAQVTIPTNCVLQFAGGSIGNGTVNFNGAYLCGNVRVLTDIEVEGKIRNNSISVKAFGAIGDGFTDDTTAFNNAVTASDNVVVPNNTYLIDAEISINLRTDSVLSLCQNAILKAKTTSNGYYQIINVENCSNVHITGGSLLGEKDTHTGTSGEHGFGIRIYRGSNISITGVRISNFWGDGVYVGARNAQTGDRSEHIIIDNVTIHDCRRQGISVVAASDIIIKNSEIYQISGTNPQAGIDFEVNYPDFPNINCVVRNCNIYNNIGPSIVVGRTLEGLVVDGCTIDRFTSSHYGKNIRITNCEIRNSLTIGNDTTNYGTTHYLENCILNKVTLCNLVNIEIRGCSLKGQLTTDKNTDISSTNINAEIYDCTFQSPYIDEDYTFLETDSIIDHFLFTSGTAAPFNRLYVYGSTFNYRSVAGTRFSYSNVCLLEGCTFKFKGISNAAITSSAYGLLDVNTPSLAGTKCYLIGNIFDFIDVASYSVLGLIRPTGEFLELINNNVFTNSPLGTFAFRSDTSLKITLKGNFYPKYTSLGRFNDAISIIRSGNTYAASVDGDNLKGTTSDRPTLNASNVGFQYFDTDLGKPIYWTGAKWVDATGNDLQ